MKFKNLEKRVFPGGNTSQGFYSFYDYLIEPNATRIIVIKGGPGVGKSTFMNKIALEMQELGYSVEFHHCSSDPKSVDGIVFPEVEIALVDGTSPHIVEPKYPGCVDEILHLGDFWDEDSLRRHKDDIIETSKEVSRLFTRAYRFLKAAKDIYDDWKAANSEGLNSGLANQKASYLINKSLDKLPIAPRVGKERHLFASAISPDGLVNYLNTVIGQASMVYVIKGEPGTGKTTLMREIANNSITRGVDVEIYHCALDPTKIEHLLIPELDVAFTTYIEPHTYLSESSEVIDMNECISKKVICKYADLVKKDEEIMDNLMNIGISFLDKARTAHNELEAYYVPNMNFDRIESIRQETVKRIIRYARETYVHKSR
jgi:Mrp family chromosome partitioning ATPase